MDQLLPLDPAEILTDQVAALTGTGGAGLGNCAVARQEAAGQPESQYGLQLHGNRIEG